MIGWEDIYKVAEAMVPLYVALVLGYASIKWFRWFDPDSCDAINRFNCYFILPFFGFQFTAGINPYLMNFRFLGADVIVKGVAGVALALWANFSKSGNLSWAITSFSLSSINNSLVVGVPLLSAMYGPIGGDLVMQSFVIQALLWLPLLIFLLEFKSARTTTIDELHTGKVAKNDKEHQNSVGVGATTTGEITSSIDHEELHINIEEIEDITTRSSIDHDEIIEKREEITTKLSPTDQDHDIHESPSTRTTKPTSSTIKKVIVKVVENPNCYACTLGVIWALIAKRWNVEMPGIILGSIQIMAKAGSGVAMFNMGQFMALQEKVIACGVRLTVYGMVLRFVVSPLLTALCCFALGLRSKVLEIAIIQAALPQATASFVYAQEYNLHSNVLSTAVIFGTFLSLPLLIVYYIGLDALH